MAPTIILKDGRPVMAVGSPGGSRIIGYVAKTIIAHIDWGMNAQQAVSLPHLVNRFGTYDLEEGTSATQLAPALSAMGYKVEAKELNSGLHVIVIGKGPDKTEVSAVDPAASMAAIDNPDLAAVAGPVRELLQDMVKGL